MTTSSSTQAPTVDVQSQLPPVKLSLTQVGVTNVEKVIRLHYDGIDHLFWARFECVVELGPEPEGRAHVALRGGRQRGDPPGRAGESPFRAETLAEHIAQLVRERQGARRAEVTVEARFPEYKPAPVSGIETQELYTLHGCAVSTEAGTRRLIGVAAQGMTACPCAQELVAAGARDAARRGWLRERRDRPHPRGGTGRDPQPARTRHAPHRPARGLGDRARRAGPARDRRAVDVI